MKLVMTRCAGAMLLGCCTVSQAMAQDAPPADSAPAAGEDHPVDILNYRVEGNTVLPRTAVEEAVMPFMGPQRPASDVEAARAALEKAYRDAGFATVAVEIPEQDVRGGIVRLAVTELAVGRLRVEGARFHSPEQIKDRLPALAEGVVPNYNQVSEQMNRLNRSGGKLVSPTLRAGDTPNTVDVDLQVEDERPAHGSFEINNRGSSRVDPLRATASLRYTNLFQAGHSVSLQGQFGPRDPKQSWIVSGSYVAPIGSHGFSLLAYGLHSDSAVGAVGGINVLGTGDTVGGRGLYSFVTGSAEAPVVHQITLGIDYKHFREDLVLGDTSSTTPIRYFPLTAQYSISLRDEKSTADLSIGITAGLRGLGASDLEYRLKRFNASASWVALHIDASYTHTLPGDWRFSSKLAAQFASGPLISNEQFAAGGLDSVRGYYENQELGDDGALAQFQIETPEWKGPQWAQDFRFFAFADGAGLHIRDPLASQRETTSLLSIGGGVHFQLFHRLNVSSLLAAPLRERSSVPFDIGKALRAQVRFWTEF